LQRSGEERDYFGLIDPLVNRIAVFVYFVFLASDALGHYCRCFVGDEAIYYGVRIGNEVEAVNGELVEASDGAIKRDDVFLEAVVRGGSVGSSGCVC
jgi:hypothetical protein